ncbi:MAG: YkgJ family cysteine cluster protein [Thermodesulfobacteriota bacterium]|nr:YkgJ family cysteine cluster protein [Thermodesulfobacteriota bacterium]
MDFDFTPYFAKYEALVNVVDGIVEKIKAAHPAEVSCKKGCTDCCYALFDLTLIEAIYLNRKFQDVLGRDAEMLEKANIADRKVYKLKKQAFRDQEKGKNEVAILAEMGRERIRCPLLNVREMCDLYDYRPITCRVYGVPTLIQGMTHTCGKSGFDEGGTYPTISMDTIYKQLYEISHELVSDIKTRYKKMGEMLVPVSMAIITDYDDAYFGFGDDEDDADTDDK